MSLVTRAEAALSPIARGFFLVTVAVFAGPVIVLGVTDDLRQSAQGVVDGLSVVLVILQLTALAVSSSLLTKQGPGRSHRITSSLLFLALLLAVANALRMQLGATWSGLAAELLGALWFASPLALWAVALWPALNRYSSKWWATPMAWLVIAFPLMFFSAALARIDFSTAFQGQVPVSVAWVLVYAPTLVAIGLGLAGWLWFEERRPFRDTARNVAVVSLTTTAIALLVLIYPGIGFVFSALVTWGSGYQLFAVPSALPPLLLPIALLTAAFIALLVTALDLRRRKAAAIVPLLALAAVLSGVFPSAISILGSLAALELLWLLAIGDYGA